MNRMQIKVAKHPKSAVIGYYHLLIQYSDDSEMLEIRLA